MEILHVSGLLQLGEGTLPWALFRFRIFSNYFSQKFEKIKVTVWKSNNLTMCPT